VTYSLVDDLAQWFARAFHGPERAISSEPVSFVEPQTS
jgi:hypothetical protein